ncbi:hypothetical protein FPV67DRAFT_507701 [Lyophyllum atratum]|nr:hypothetical protein FPV67DRAFT_507701 [Lyophyllum atratum]
MGDVGMGLVYLCTCCCKLSRYQIQRISLYFCVHLTGFGGTENNDEPSCCGRSKRKDPREKEIEDHFAARNYTRDASGRIVTQPTPSNSMLTSRNNTEVVAKHGQSNLVNPPVSEPPR